MEKLKALLTQFNLDKYLGDLMTMGVFSIEDLCTLDEEDVLEIIGIKDNPDYDTLSNLVIKVKRRYKSRSNSDNNERIEPLSKAIKNAFENKKTKVNHDSEYSAKKDIFGLCAIVLGVVILIVGYVKEGLYFDDMLLYFLGFTLLTLVGIYLIKPEYFFYGPSLLLVFSLTLFSFSLFFILCESCYSGDITDFDMYDASAGATIFLIASLIISFLSTYNLLNKIDVLKKGGNNRTNNLHIKTEEKSDITPSSNETDQQKILESKGNETVPTNVVLGEKHLTESFSTCSFINENIGKEEPYESLPKNLETTDRLRWSTRINGKSFRYAWFVSYFFLPLSLMLNFVFLISCLSYSDPDLFYISLVIGSIIFSVMTFSGLFVFKHYSYICIQITFIISLISGVLSLINQTVMYFSYPYISKSQYFYFAIIYSLTLILFNVLSLWYFYKRKEFFNG